MTSREYWAEIEDFPRYLVSSHGRITNRESNRIHYPTVANRPHTTLTNEFEQKQFVVHNLVACAFFREEARGCKISHIDGDRTNNAVWNLEIVGPDKRVRGSRFELVREEDV